MHAVHLVLILALLFIALGAANVQSYEGRTNPLLDPRVAPLQTLVTEQDSRIAALEMQAAACWPCDIDVPVVATAVPVYTMEPPVWIVTETPEVPR